MDAEAAGLSIGLGGTGICIEEVKVCSIIIFHLGHSQEMLF